MKLVFKIFFYVFAVFFWLSVLDLVFDDFWDVWMVWGVIGLICAVICAPGTVLLFPMILGVIYNQWEQALSTYIILPVLWFIYCFLRSKAGGKFTTSS